jgi:hypothetical protein
VGRASLSNKRSCTDDYVRGRWLMNAAGGTIYISKKS